MRSLLEDFIDCLYFINLILLSILIFKNYCKKNGAGDGNRTRVTSLEGWSSAIELRLQMMADLTRIELAIFSVTGRHVSHYTTDPF